jgi:hypothetical protein
LRTQPGRGHLRRGFRGKYHVMSGAGVQLNFDRLASIYALKHWRA